MIESNSSLDQEKYVPQFNQISKYNSKTSKNLKKTIIIHLISSYDTDYFLIMEGFIFKES